MTLAISSIDTAPATLVPLMKNVGVDSTLYSLMARWRTYGYGRNTTGSGPLRTETAKDVLVPLCQLLDKVCPTVTWTQAHKLFHEIAAGTLGEQGTYAETTGDGVLEEYESTYAYQAVKLYPLHQWLSENGLL